MPKRIIIICLFCIISPIANSIHLLSPYGLHRVNWNIIYKVFFPYKIFLLLFPLVLAYGIYKKKLLSFYLLLFYGCFLFANNLYTTYQNFNHTNLSIVFQTVLLLGIAPLVLYKDLRSPFFSEDPKRGWRRKKRFPSSLLFRLVDGTLIKSINVSESGILFTKPSGIDFQKEQNIDLVMENNSEKRKISGKIKRIHNGSFAVAIPSEDGKFLIQEAISK